MAGVDFSFAEAAEVFRRPRFFITVIPPEAE